VSATTFTFRVPSSPWNKLVLPPAARGGVDIGDSPEAIVEQLAAALSNRPDPNRRKRRTDTDD
jgi:hypothetical protein